jgi:hypothetical protein
VEVNVLPELLPKGANIVEPDIVPRVFKSQRFEVKSSLYLNKFLLGTSAKDFVLAASKYITKLLSFTTLGL